MPMSEPKPPTYKVDLDMKITTPHGWELPFKFHSEYGDLATAFSSAIYDLVRMVMVEQARMNRYAKGSE